MEVGGQQKTEFLEALWGYYAHGARDLPWRVPEANGGFDPYKIMVSELMLQQTQVPRVVPKYHEFLGLFPSARMLARADLGDVLRAWQGLGYNRRAKFLYEAARHIDLLGYFPDTSEDLVKLPGVGSNTAGAIAAYAYNKPSVFIETNVRTVYIHHFFADKMGVTDKEVAAVLQATLDRENPREFYWALMDYGTHLKTTVGNAGKASRHYTKQSRFEGSRRQVRGQVIRTLGSGSWTLHELQAVITDARLQSVLADLVTEGLIRERNGAYGL